MSTAAARQTAATTQSSHWHDFGRWVPTGATKGLPWPSHDVAWATLQQLLAVAYIVPDLGRDISFLDDDSNNQYR